MLSPIYALLFGQNRGKLFPSLDLVEDQISITYKTYKTDNKADMQEIIDQKLAPGKNPVHTDSNIDLDFSCLRCFWPRWQSWSCNGPRYLWPKSWFAHLQEHYRTRKKVRNQANWSKCIRWAVFRSYHNLWYGKLTFTRRESKKQGSRDSIEEKNVQEILTQIEVKS